MSTYAEDCRAVRDNTMKAIRQLDQSVAANPQSAISGTYSLNGLTMGYNEYRAALWAQHDKAALALQRADPVDFVTVARG